MTKEAEDTISQLLGVDSPEDRRTARQRRTEEALARLTENTKRRSTGDETVAPEGMETLRIADVQHGVSIGTLSQIFNQDPTTVRKKLLQCPVLHRKKTGFIYDLKVAAQYLVRPVFNVEQYLKTMRPADMPTHLQEAYWSAQRKRQQWEADAGHLWRTESVLEVLGEVFKTIKFAMQLWPDEVERAQGLTPEQRATLINMSDALQKTIHERLVEMPSLRRTPPTLYETNEPSATRSEEEDLDDVAARLL